ncbi:MAG TPA: SAM-dependent methyltransferase [Thermoanaerobaculia bacterium]|nr:SAM-dependent methyltransferase [Thermoanaerobaculia bacterium]
MAERRPAGVHPEITPGRLTVVGTGIRSVAQTTREASDLIAAGERVFYVVADPITEAWLRELNPHAESLYDAYTEGKPRIESYREMVERILAPVSEGRHVVAVFYGHPGVFVNPSHEAVRRARAEGYAAEMFPGVSAEDCLFADLGVDPAPLGCSSFEATDFLVYRRRFDPGSHLVLWQIGVVGELAYRKRRPTHDRGVAVLAETLLEHYPPEHEVVIYEASQLVVCAPIIERLPLSGLATGPVTSMSTLYVPPRERRPPDRAMLERLGLPPP